MSCNVRRCNLHPLCLMFGEGNQNTAVTIQTFYMEEKYSFNATPLPSCAIQMSQQCHKARDISPSVCLARYGQCALRFHVSNEGV